MDYTSDISAQLCLYALQEVVSMRCIMWNKGVSDMQSGEFCVKQKWGFRF
uniref:Uncharacterized protein n=1 Tax=viral metagenome TaxID=1070528 RepID=A0A6M3LS32_9ZZZZ